MTQGLNLTMQADSTINKNMEDMVGRKYNEFHFRCIELQRAIKHLGVDV